MAESAPLVRTVKGVEVAKASAQSAPDPANDTDVKVWKAFEYVKPHGQQGQTVPWLSPWKMVRTKPCKKYWIPQSSAFED